jgi:hypothetical protein
LEKRIAAIRGGSFSKVEDVPPSWSTNTRAPFGLGSRTLWSCTSTPATPRGAGSPETTTSAAFWRGVSGGRGGDDPGGATRAATAWKSAAKPMRSLD